MTAEFRSSRIKATRVAVGCAAMAALAAGAAVTEQSIWPWFGTAYFGVGVVMVLLNGFYRPATLRLDAQGIRFTHWRTKWSIAWGEVADVQLVVLRINWFRVNANVVLRDLAGAKRTISSGLTITPDALAALIRSRSAATAAESASRAEMSG